MKGNEGPKGQNKGPKRSRSLARAKEAGVGSGLKPPTYILWRKKRPKKI